MKVVLIGLFFITATLYSSVGFGGGSSYTALLVLFGVNYALIPILSLSCNILVVSGSSWRFMKAGLIDFSTLWPFLVFSVPLAWLGGQYPIDEAVFVVILALALLLSGLSLLLKPEHYIAKFSTLNRPLFHAGIGGGLGLLSGVVGIGGGIFLAPILYLIGWGSDQNRSLKIAALSSLFILVNSVSGLAGQLTKWENLQQLQSLTPYWPLVIAVLLGGFLGNRLGLQIFSQQTIRKLTAALILFVALRLLWEFYQL